MFNSLFTSHRVTTLLIYFECFVSPSFIGHQTSDQAPSNNISAFVSALWDCYNWHSRFGPWTQSERTAFIESIYRLRTSNVKNFFVSHSKYFVTETETYFFCDRNFFNECYSLSIEYYDSVKKRLSNSYSSILR